MYHVTAWCALPHYTTFEVQAESLQGALSKAREQVIDESPEPCNGGYEWHEFEIRPEDDYAPGLSYLEPSRLAANAAEELLQAVIGALSALNEDAEGRGPSRRAAIELCRAAIAKATQQ